MDRDEIAQIIATEIRRLHGGYPDNRNYLEAADAILSRLQPSGDVNEPLIANLTYKGNSVTWWHSKAENYKAALGRAWNALIANGINPDGLMDVAGGIHALAGKDVR